MTAQAKKREMIEYSTTNLYDQQFLPSMLSEFELNEAIAKTIATIYFPVSPMADTEMFHRTSSPMQTNRD